LNDEGEARVSTPNRSCIDSNIKRRGTTTTPVDNNSKRFDQFNNRPSAPPTSRNAVSYELGQHFRTFQTLPQRGNLDEKVVLQRLLQDYQTNESNFHQKYEEEVHKHE
jgi:hypothetical protein